MLKRRVIPCLDIDQGRVVKGVNFKGIREVGDPIELAKRYENEGADELVFLDISATVERRKTRTQLVNRVAKELSIPFTVGGGITTVYEAKEVIDNGADKVGVNSAAVRNPLLVTQIAERLGAQCVVLSLDIAETTSGYRLAVKGGRELTNIDAFEFIASAESLGAGELLLTSIAKDGTRSGFDIKLLREAGLRTKLPIIASGGAGVIEHFTEVYQQTEVTAALAASIFHNQEISINQLKESCKRQDIPVRSL
ncbi:imidazole glycerol phosphate synthase subunit HisF [Sanyastnella coralliicola]|uniref:imidazole glycerol phosphate synthase subunit HisF n=1 Tax=Sanyastnella coralliicola TaxID=3069118 RepID=UPI0027B89929|nr:imidazole glycerol phosphate synthase subunit HisF [Longitalea sp. SCSIO 12813]